MSDQNAERIYKRIGCSLKACYMIRTFAFRYISSTQYFNKESKIESRCSKINKSQDIKSCFVLCNLLYPVSQLVFTSSDGPKWYAQTWIYPSGCPCTVRWWIPQGLRLSGTTTLDLPSSKM